MKSQKYTLRRWFPIVGVSLMSVLALSCTPAVSPATTTVPTTVPSGAARAVLSVSSGIAGSYVQVAPPDGSCAALPGIYGSMQAVLTVPRTGVIISTGYSNSYYGPDLSGYVTQDGYVNLRIPNAIIPARYNVFLSCYSYQDQYAFAPASFTVLPG